MSLAKLQLEGLLDNTYGIEVEFGTHDNQMLSFTHIEVCYLFPFGSDRDKGWKIETDADYTLEIVSPILKFRGQQDARNFRDDLMRLLEQQVRNGIQLGELMRLIGVFVSTKFTFANGIWTFAVPQAPLNLRTEWISNIDLINDLSWENWDEDTDLERVLGSKQVLINEILNLGQVPANNATTVRMQQVLVTASRKHGGLPSSQLNLPLELAGFARYETKYKRDKAWERLLETETSTPEYVAEKIQSLRNDYPNLVATNPVWCAKHLNTDYIESQIDEKTPAWHRYWLWLETFYVCAGQLTRDDYTTMTRINAYVAAIDQTVNDGYPSRTEAQISLARIRQVSTQLFDANYLNNFTADLLYLIVHKLVGGALAELSETLQKNAQEKIMALKGDFTMEQIKDMIPDNQFMQFHYALKDLTSLWFKAPLVDVLTTENQIQAKTPHVTAANQRILNFPPNALAGMICKVLKAHQKLLGWYFAVSEANNQGYDYDWEEFCAYNMPCISAFQSSLLTSCTDLAAYTNAPGLNMTMLCTNAQLPQQYGQLPEECVQFLKRNYTAADNVPFMALNNIAAASIASWEGRWDTMKPVIMTDPLRPRYLVEHRNN